jgi:SAM-dependent methyltransferase
LTLLNPDEYRRNLLVYTTAAFNLLPPMRRPLVLDAGCGTGVPTLQLAELTEGVVVAANVDEMALCRLRKTVRKRDLADRVMPVRCALERMQFPNGVFDLVWSEGSVWQIGFARALDVLGGCTKNGGCLVVHDEAANYWQKLQAVEKAGWLLHGFFVLSDEAWWHEFYRNLERKLPAANAVQPPYDLRSIGEEIERFKRTPYAYRSAFFAMRKP